MTLDDNDDSVELYIPSSEDDNDINRLKRKIQELQEQNEQLKADNIKIARACDILLEQNKELTNKQETVTPLLSSRLNLNNALESVIDPANLRLVMVLKTPGGRSITDFRGPYHFPARGSFPHAVNKNQLFEVETRRQIFLKFALVDEKGHRVTEFSLKENGDVFYLIQLYYADNKGLVHESHMPFCQALTSPKIGQPMQMFGGFIGLSLKVNVSSTDTHPCKRMFCFKAIPCDNSLKMYPNMIAESPPFMTRSRMSIRAEEKDASGSGHENLLEITCD